jgi:hypothetical protein
LDALKNGCSTCTASRPTPCDCSCCRGRGSISSRRRDLVEHARVARIPPELVAHAAQALRHAFDDVDRFVLQEVHEAAGGCDDDADHEGGADDARDSPRLHAIDKRVERVEEQRREHQRNEHVAHVLQQCNGHGHGDKRHRDPAEIARLLSNFAFGWPRSVSRDDADGSRATHGADESQVSRQPRLS